MNLAIQKTAHNIMLAHCQEIYPFEACGFLGGQDELAVVVTIVENALNSPVAYEMDPLQQLEAMLDIENNGLDLLAAYHSHPHGPSRPSPTDLAQAYYPDLPQIIISLQVRSEPLVRAFLLASGTYQELQLRIV